LSRPGAEGELGLMKHIAKIATVLLMVTFLWAEPAGAVINVTTHTKLAPSKTKIHKGDLVKFKVTLEASKNKCRVHMPIKLYMGQKVVGKKKTNDKGKVVFKKHPKKTAKWWAKFPGKKLKTHPERTNCLASKSKKKKVVVKP
jgi:hypothetical protein